jgi:diaminopimelate epimerase
VNFVQRLDNGAIRVRTYERGVEGETLACGTGVTASALVSSELHGLKSPVQVQVQGGDMLEVSFKKNGGGFEEVMLTGPADFVFEGRVPLQDR